MHNGVYNIWSDGDEEDYQNICPDANRPGTGVLLTFVGKSLEIIGKRMLLIVLENYMECIPNSRNAD